MILRRILFFLLVTFLIPACAQNNSVSENLKRELRHAEGTRKTDLLFQLYLEHNTNDSAFIYIDQLQQEADRTKNEEEKIKMMAIRIQAFVNTNHSDSVLKYAPQVIRYMRKQKAYKHMFSVQNLLIELLVGKRQFDAALLETNQQYEIAKELKYPFGLAMASKNLGLIYHYTGRNKEALKFYKESIAFLKNTNEKSVMVNIYLDIIIAERELDKNAQALEECKQCFKLLEKNSAFAKNTVEKNTIRAQFYTCLGFQASIYIKLGKLKEAKESIDAALKLASPSWEGAWLFPLWEAQLNYNIAIQNYCEALKFNQLLEQHSSKDQFSMRMFLAGSKADIYVGMSRYKEACYLYRDLLAGKDSLANINFGRQLDEVCSLYEIDKLKIQAEKNRLDMILLLAGTSALFIVCLLLGILIFIIRKNTKNLEEKNRNLFLQLKEKDALQTEIARLTQYSPQTRNKEVAVAPNSQRETILFERFQQWLAEERTYTNPKITPEKAAAQLSTNSRYLCEAIRKTTNQTFNDYINTLRLEYARKLLLSADKEQMTIEAISTEAGFNTRSNFYRLFRMKYGLTPSELKKQYKEILKEQA